MDGLMDGWIDGWIQICMSRETSSRGGRALNERTVVDT